MEGFLVLIVLAAVYNIINSFIKKAGGQQQGQVLGQAPQRSRAAGGFDRFIYREEEIPAPGPKRMRPSKQEKAAFEGERASKEPAPAASAAPLASPPKVPVSPDNTTSSVSGSLQQMLSRQDQLVAAFIFHEILERPRSMRK